MNGIILIGGGGHCKSAIDVMEAERKYEILGVIDNSLAKDERVCDYTVIGTDDAIPKHRKAQSSFLICIGQIKSAKPRMSSYNRVIQAKGSLATVVSPFAHVSRHAEISAGSIIMHSSLVNSHSLIGENCIINSMCLIEHDCLIGKHCHISTGAKLNGGVTVGQRCFIGSGAIIKNGITLGNDVVIGAGCVVKHDVIAGSILK